MAMVNVVSITAYGRIYWLRLIGLVQRSAATWRCVLHSSDEPGELSQWQCHGDSTVDFLVAIIITIIITSSTGTMSSLCRTQSLELPSGRHSRKWLGQLLSKGFKDIFVPLTFSIDQTRCALVIDFPCYGALVIVSVIIIF